MRIIKNEENIVAPLATLTFYTAVGVARCVIDARTII